MNDQDAPEWAQSFENKSVSELAALPVPEGLATRDSIRWKIARHAALEAARASEGLPESAPLPAPREEPLPESRSERVRRCAALSTTRTAVLALLPSWLGVTLTNRLDVLTNGALPIE